MLIAGHAKAEDLIFCYKRYRSRTVTLEELQRLTNQKFDFIVNHTGGTILFAGPILPKTIETINKSVLMK